MTASTPNPDGPKPGEIGHCGPTLERVMDAGLRGEVLQPWPRCPECQAAEDAFWAEHGDAFTAAPSAGSSVPSSEPGEAVPVHTCGAINAPCEHPLCSPPPVEAERPCRTCGTGYPACFNQMVDSEGDLPCCDACGHPAPGSGSPAPDMRPVFHVWCGDPESHDQHETGTSQRVICDGEPPLTPPSGSPEADERPWVCAFGNPFCNAQIARPSFSSDNRHAQCWRNNTRPAPAPSTPLLPVPEERRQQLVSAIETAMVESGAGQSHAFRQANIIAGRFFARPAPVSPVDRWRNLPEWNALAERWDGDDWAAIESAVEVLILAAARSVGEGERQATDETLRGLVSDWSNRAARQRNRMFAGSLDAADTYETCADELAVPGDRPALDRDSLGQMVREVWVAWANEQANPKPTWLVGWEDLPEPDREVDRRIGEALWLRGVADAQPAHPAPDGDEVTT